MIARQLLVATAVALFGLTLTIPASAEDNAGTSATTEVASAATASANAAGAGASDPEVTREVFGEWELECFEPKVNGLNCQIVQKLVSSEAKQLVLVISMAFTPEKDKHLLQMALPLNFLLKPGVEIAIGDSKTVAHVDRCSAQGCFIEGVAGDDLVKAMIKEAKGDVKFLASAEKRVIIPFSLIGFSKAYDQMKKRNAAG